VSIDLLHRNDDLDSRRLTERVAFDGESTTFNSGERSSVVPIGQIGTLSEALSGGAARMYLREIAQYELLAASEEVSLAQRIEASKAALKELAADANMDDVHRTELERLVEDGGLARRRLIECNLRLVVSVARRYLGHRLSLLDLVQEET
jgi:DNA-directed RNA polymerase sigma subunit (sigma70/sigma32)